MAMTLNPARLPGCGLLSRMLGKWALVPNGGPRALGEKAVQGMRPLATGPEEANISMGAMEHAAW